MITRRAILAVITGLTTQPKVMTSVETEAEPYATLDTFYGVLVAVMKEGQKLGFTGRSERLAPAVRKAFNLPVMTRLVTGPRWQEISTAEQQQLISAFSDFSVATYAGEFRDYSGERFDVDRKVDAATGGDVIVHTKFIQPTGKPVQLDYLLRRDGDKWRIIDVYLDGTISQDAARRSEFSALLSQDGVAGLIAALKDKTAKLSGQ